VETLEGESTLGRCLKSSSGDDGCCYDRFGDYGWLLVKWWMYEDVRRIGEKWGALMAW
jgi:hypothetical protein